MIVFILGRQPEIGLAELTAVYGANPTLISRNIATMNIDMNTALAQAKRLGSVVKIAGVISQDFAVTKANLATLVTQLFANTEGKITLGISYYDDKATKKSSIQLGQELQNILRQAGHSVRLLPTTAAVLPTATALHNGLARNNPKKVELNVIRPHDKSTSPIIAKTIYIQDIDAYTFRDRRRPRRDARNGMLPPKLAQTIINLARGASNLSDQPANLLDPFCGTGVVLQEAALMGLNTYGTDLNPTMIDHTNTNLAWLETTHHLKANLKTAPGDATDFNWQEWASPNQINLVATETYLGRPYTTTPHLPELKNNIANCDVVIGKFLANLGRQLPSGSGACIGVPVWFIRDHIHHLTCVDRVMNYGFTNQAIGANLIYHRPDQIVGRELLVLQKR